MTTDDLARCPACPQTFPDRQGLRRHTRLDHTADPAGAALLQELLTTGPDAGPAAAPAAPADPGAAGPTEVRPGPDLGVRLGMALVAGWLAAPLGLLLLVD